MNKLPYLLVCLLFAAGAAMGQKKKTSDDVIQSMDNKKDDYSAIADRIWNFAEVGYQETQSSQLLQETLKNAGFKVDAGVADMPTSFVASYGSGKPVIGILAEFDALPGLSQQALPEPISAEGKAAGHGCGHHLFGTASSAAGIAVKEYMEKNKIKGTIRVYGTPAEEGGGGKIYMVRAGLMEDVDAMLEWHPGNSNSASPSTSLANKTGKFRFYGKSAHAAGAPEQGRSALDAIEAMNFMLNMMREHVTPETRIHYIITKGGDAPNVVPNFAEGYYYVRHPDIMEVKNLWERMVKTAEGAAIGTETRMEYEVLNGVYNILPNETLAKIMQKNMEIVGGYTLTPDEIEFAKKIQATLVNKPDLNTTQKIKPYKLSISGGSSDVGDVSWVVPTTGLTAATWVPGTPAHSWQAVAAGGTDIGHKGMMIAAKTLALTAIELLNSPEVIKASWVELRSKTGEGFQYESLIGDRKPPLDYRK